MQGRYNKLVLDILIFICITVGARASFLTLTVLHFSLLKLFFFLLFLLLLLLLILLLTS
jgi:hypothetical protein